MLTNKIFLTLCVLFMIVFCVNRLIGNEADTISTIAFAVAAVKVAEHFVGERINK